MLAETREVRTLSDLVQVVAGLRSDRRWIFRGQQYASWKLVPKAGREDMAPEVREGGDQNWFRSWAELAVAFDTSRCKHDWDLLALAQHHGLPTRLLDWSGSAMMAAFFAVEEESGVDATITCLRAARLIVDNAGPGPFSRRWRGIRAFRPRRIHSRVTQQMGIFTIHNPPHLSLEDIDAADMSEGDWAMLKLIVPGECKLEMRLQLHALGIDRSSLFGDLDGLSRQMEWEMRKHASWEVPYVLQDIGDTSYELDM